MPFTIGNANTLQLLTMLNRASAQQALSLQRLASGKRINSGADDPAGFIALQSLLAEASSVDSALAGAQRAKSYLSVADGALAEISSLLGDIQSLASASANTGALSASEIAANQAELDAAIDSIDRIARTTSFNGVRLLDGSQSIQVAASNTAKIGDARAYTRRSTSSSDTLAIKVNTAATVASAVFANNPTSISAASFTIAGALGNVTIDVANGDSLATVRDRIIASVGQTGVSASITGNTLKVQTREYGSNSFMQVTRISGDADFASVSRTAGTNASVSVGGQTGQTDGLRVTFNTSGISGEFTLTTAGNVAGGAGNLVVSGGGATFQLGTDSSTRATIGIDSLDTGRLGDSNTGYLSSLKSGGANTLAANPAAAIAIARKAVAQLATAQGRLGAFQRYQVDTSINSLNALKASLADATSSLNDVDFAAETAMLNRQNVLLQAGSALLGVANQQMSSILSLLR